MNALALAATTVWKQPLPDVLKEYIMYPIGASNSWIWQIAKAMDGLVKKVLLAL